LARCDNLAAFRGGTNWMKSEGIALRHWTRRYSSQRDEFHHRPKQSPFPFNNRLVFP